MSYAIGNKQVSAKSLQTAYKCGECLHFKEHAHPSKEQLCAADGIRAFAIAPRCFTPDVKKIITNSDVYVQLASIMQTFTPQQRRILRAVLIHQPKKKYQFGDKLFFRVGNDYISNYLSGYVIGYTSSNKIILSGSPDNKTRGKSFMSVLMADENLLTLGVWRQKYQQLRAAGKLVDPDNRVIKKPSIVDDYTPPTMDTVPARWYTKQEPVVKIRVKKEDEQASSFDMSAEV